MRAMWGLVLWSALCARAAAVPTVVTVGHMPYSLTCYQHSGEGHPDGPVQTLQVNANGNFTADLAHADTYHFQGIGPNYNFFWHYEVDEDYHASPGVALTLTERRTLDGTRVGLVVALGLGVVALGLVGAWRKVRRANLQLDAKAADVAALNAASGLFPTDGSLPRLIPPYRVLDKLGSGGMAVVYKVANEEGQTFALKLPLPNLLSDSKFLQRFTREAKIGLRLRHPNLVSMLYVNDDSNPTCPWPYLVMELVEGTPLDKLLEERHHLPEDEVLPILLDVLAGLQVVHQHGIVHRDIKPGNIMLTRRGRARLMDFGVAHKAETSGLKLTATEEILGTPLYMAPEQIMSRPLDGRCDLYAVGAMMYEMLAGDLPFGTGDSYTVLGLKCTMPLPPVSTRAEVSPTIAALVDALVAIEPDDRPATVGEVMQRIEAHLGQREA